MTRRAPRWLLAAALLAATPAAGPAQFRQEPLQKQPPPQLQPTGVDLFCGLLLMQRMQPLSRTDWNFGRDYGDIVFISLGHIPGSEVLLRANRVKQEGGAVLIATDGSADLGNLFPDWWQQETGHARVTGWPVTATENETFYDEHPHCPFVVPLPAPDRAGPEWKLFDGLRRVATNRPSYLQVPPRRRDAPSAVAGFPPNCKFAVGFGQPQFDLNPAEFPFAVASVSAPGRTLVLADPGVFVNEMMFPVGDAPPTDNMTFARRVIAFLQEGRRQPRGHFVLYLNGQQVSDFAPLVDMLRKPDVVPTPPPIGQVILGMQEKLTDAGNTIVDRLEEGDAFNRTLLGTGDEADQRLRGIIGTLMLLASVWAVWKVLRRVWGTRQPADVPPPPPGGRPPGQAAGAGVFDRRQRELLRRNNLYEPARDAARELFAAAGAPPEAGPKLPRVEVASAVRRPETLRRALGELWRVAHGPPRVVTVQDWDALEPLLVRARRAFADGKWRFAGAGVGAEAGA